MLHTVADADALFGVLDDINQRGEQPSVAFMDSAGVTGVAYGIDRGDEMGMGYLSDPGEDRMHANSPSDDVSYIEPFERSVEDLRYPLVVLYPNHQNRSQ